MSGTFRCGNCKVAVEDTSIAVSGPATGTIYGRGYAYERNGVVVFEYDETIEDETYIDSYDTFECGDCGYPTSSVEELFVFVEDVPTAMPDADGRPVKEGDTILVVGDYHGEPQVEDLYDMLLVVDSVDGDDTDYPFKVCPDTGGEVWLCSQDVRLHTAPVLNEKDKPVNTILEELFVVPDQATQALMDLGL